MQTRTRQQQIYRSFKRFHESNPHVFELFSRFTLQVIAAGRESYSAYAIFNRLRWHAAVGTDLPDLKLSNNHQPYYARLFHVAYPQHDGFFRCRKLFSAERPEAGDPDKFPVSEPENEAELLEDLRMILIERGSYERGKESNV